MDPTIEIVGVNLDEEQCTTDEWLYMRQQKRLIDMMLFGVINPLAYRNQVEENMFAEEEVENQGYEASTKSKREEENKYIIPAHNE